MTRCLYYYSIKLSWKSIVMVLLGSLEFILRNGGLAIGPGAEVGLFLTELSEFFR